MLFGHYTFSSVLLDQALLPPFKGSTFRGAFGVALKRVVCAVREKRCDACMLASRCIYARVFETFSSSEASSARMVVPPHPYTIEPMLEDAVRYSPGESFDFNLLLFGEFNGMLPYFVYAFEVMGENGVGKRIEGNRRSRFKLESVLLDGVPLYDPKAGKLLATASAGEMKLGQAPERAGEMELSLTLKTPLRLKFENRLKADLPFHLLVRAALRRISSLFAAYGGGEPELDYRGLVAHAADVQVVSSTLRWFDWERYSDRQERAMLMGGMTGSVTYRGNIAEFLPLIEAAKQLHIGKQTSFGLGLFDYEWKELQ